MEARARTSGRRSLGCSRRETGAGFPQGTPSSHPESRGGALRLAVSLLQISLRQGAKLQLWFSCQCLEIEVRRPQPKNLPKIPPKKTSQKKQPLHHREYIGFLVPAEPSGLARASMCEIVSLFLSVEEAGFEESTRFPDSITGFMTLGTARWQHPQACRVQGNASVLGRGARAALSLSSQCAPLLGRPGLTWGPLRVCSGRLAPCSETHVHSALSFPGGCVETLRRPSISVPFWGDLQFLWSSFLH